MSPRSKQIPDDHLIATAADMVGQRGAEHTRLADVAAASGLAAATLIQRFGTRQALLDAVGYAFIGRMAEYFTRPAPSHLDRIVGALEEVHAAGHFSFMLSSRSVSDRYSLELRKQIGYALANAMAAGELAPCDVADQARRILLAFYGLAAATLLEHDRAEAESVRGIVREVLADYV